MWGMNPLQEEDARRYTNGACQELMGDMEIPV
jgi:hypothetical protein